MTPRDFTLIEAADPAGLHAERFEARHLIDNGASIERRSPAHDAPRTCLDLARYARAGTVWTNTWIDGFVEPPFGAGKEKRPGPRVRPLRARRSFRR